MAFLGGAIGFLGGAIDTAQGLFGNPRDDARFAEANMLRDRALQGDSFSYWKLRCLSGDNSQVTRDNVVRFGWQQPGFGPCGYATGAAREYAKVKLAEVDARVQIANASGIITLVSAQVGTTAAPGPYVATVAPALGSHTLAAVPTWVWIVGAGGLAFLLMKRGR